MLFDWNAYATHHLDEMLRMSSGTHHVTVYSLKGDPLTVILRVETNMGLSSVVVGGMVLDTATLPVRADGGPDVPGLIPNEEEDTHADRG